MEDNVSKIKEKLDVIDVISGYIKIQKSGINYKGRCPFHNEKTPSFFVSPERQIWHCFGCQKGGDMFTFVQEMEGIEFGEALKALADKAGIQLATYDIKEKDTKSRLYEICEIAAKFFEKQIHYSKTGNQALVYLKERGLADLTIKNFRLGFAPNDWRSLSNFLKDNGYTEKEIVDSGMSLKKEGGADIYDRFRSRIIFPVLDINNKVIGFSGRIFETRGGRNEEVLQNKTTNDVGRVTSFAESETQSPPSVAKYINTPQTAIYDKSRVLYGLNLAKPSIRLKNRCLLVEGNIDVIMSYQAGVQNAVATSGTALTQSHLQLLQRYTNNLDFCFDTDQAGAVATRRGLGMAIGQNFNVKVVQIDDPDSKDPADYVKKFARLTDGQGVNRWQKLVETAKPVLDFYFDKFRTEVDIHSVEGKKNLVVSLTPFIKRLNSQVERSHWVSKIATLIKVSDSAVASDIERVKDDLAVYVSNHEPQELKKVEKKETLSSEILEEALLAVAFKDISAVKPLVNDAINIVSKRTADILSILNSAESSPLGFKNLSTKLGEKLPMEAEFAYLRAQELLSDFNESELREEFINIKNRILRKRIDSQLGALNLDIRLAESSGDKKKLVELLVQSNNLNQQLNLIQFNSNEKNKEI